MDADQQALWRRLEAFSFDDPGASFPFSARLARDHGWRPAHAWRVLEEYRRFLFLSAVAGHVVCPSEEVDAAWHLHLTYTRSYWRELCGGVLGRELHHAPTQGGVAEGAKHVDLYRRTLESYRRFFGEAPADIWPSAEERFGPRLRYRWVDLELQWVVPRPSFRRLRRALAPPSGSRLGARKSPGRVSAGAKGAEVRVKASALTIAPLLLAIANPFDLRGPVFLRLYVSLLAVAVAVALALRHLLRERGELRRVPREEIGLYEVAYLAGGSERVFQTAIVALAEREMVHLGDEGLEVAAREHEPPEEPVERALYVALKREPERSQVVAREAAQREASRIAANLARLGLVETAASFAAVRGWTSLLFGTLGGFGLIKLVVGVARHRPVFYLVLLLIATFLAMLFFMPRPRCTLLGREALEELESKVRSGTVGRPAPDPILGSVALLGGGMLADTALADYESWFRKSMQQPGSDSGCGAGCGGDGGCGGGGCGGCGGD